MGHHGVPRGTTGHRVHTVHSGMTCGGTRWRTATDDFRGKTSDPRYRSSLIPNEDHRQCGDKDRSLHWLQTRYIH
ncbi:hypothetical protein ACOMHN_052355 [Nucella lapillus]